MTQAQTHDAAWYDDAVRMYTRFALEFIQDALTVTDETVANDIHEWLNAFDSVLVAHDEAVEIEIAQAIIEHSQHPDRVTPPTHPGDEDYVHMLQYTAANVLVRDIMVRIGRTYTMPSDSVADLSSQVGPGVSTVEVPNADH